MSWDPALWFLHGTAFFYMSAVLWVLAPRAVRLDVARRLPLLASFGLCESLLAWERALAPALGASKLLPLWLRLGVTGVGYGLLLAFGLELPVSPERRLGWRRWLSIALPVGWGAAIAIGAVLGFPMDRVVVGAETVARCLLAAPGAILAAWGMRRQALPGGEPRWVASARTPLRVAELSLGGLGVLFAAQAVADLFLFPLAPLYAACAVGVTWGLVRSVNRVQLEIERWIEGVEQTQALMADRERISRELHDGIIQSIYAAGLMLEGVMQAIPDDPAAAQSQLSHAMLSLDQTIQDIRRYIFNLRGGLSEAGLEEGLEAMLRDFRVNTLLETRMVTEGEPIRPLSAEERAHIFQIAREALSNVARHAQARSVEVRLSYGESALRLEIADDGVGLRSTMMRGGHGLRNIRERARLLGGTLDIDSAPGEGVRLTLTVPY